MHKFRPVPIFLLVVSMFISIGLGNLSRADAADFRLYGYDTATMGTANSNVAYGRSFGVLFSNPALMSRFAPQTSVMITVVKPHLSISLMDRPAAADVSLAYYDSNVSRYSHIQDRPLPTIELANQRADNNVNNAQTYLTAGFSFSFGIEGFRVGSLVVLPVVDVLNVNSFYNDEREQYFSNTVHFARLGESSPIMGGIVGASYSPIKYISLGLAMQISATMVADMSIFIPEATVQGYGLMNMTQMKAAVKFRPIIGVQVEPTDFMSFGITWRNESYIATDASGALNMWNYHEDDLSKTVPKRVVQEYNLVLDYEPMEVSTAVGFNYAGWDIQAGITWNRWSEYISHHAERPQDEAVNEIVNVGDLVVNGDDYKWMDTISVSMGTTYKYLGHYEARLGFRYAPSPVPSQSGRTSYADSDMWCLSAGHGFEFEVFEQQFGFDLGLQFWQFVKRTTYKDPNQIRDEFGDASVTILQNSELIAAKGLQTNNPGYPGYTQKGWIIVSSASFTYKF